MRTLEIDFRADPRWVPFVAEHPQGTVCHHPLWLEALAKEHGQRIIALACESGDGQLRAILWPAIHDACKAGFRFSDFGEVPERNTPLAVFKRK